MHGSIEVLVSPQGDVTLKTSGFQGSDCLKASRFLEAALGDVVHEQKTAEYYQSAQHHDHVQQQ